MKHDIRAFYKDKYDPKKTSIKYRYYEWTFSVLKITNFSVYL